MLSSQSSVVAGYYSQIVKGCISFELEQPAPLAGDFSKAEQCSEAGTAASIASTAQVYLTSSFGEELRACTNMGQALHQGHQESAKCIFSKSPQLTLSAWKFRYLILRNGMKFSRAS